MSRAGDWRIERGEGPAFARCVPLAAIGPFRHGFSTRLGPGDTSLDFRPSAPSRERSCRALLHAIGLPGARLVEVRQVHGGRVLPGTAAGPDDEADALTLLATDAGIAAAVRTADCVPVLLADREGRGAAVVHAGWRGVVAGVVRRAVRDLAGRGSAPDRLVAAIGPAIGGCCYEVGTECAAAVAGAAGVGVGEAPVFPPGDGRRVDLREAVVRQLREAGVPGPSVHVAPWCTRCEPDLWFSHRGEEGRAGRMLAVIGVPGESGRP